MKRCGLIVKLAALLCAVITIVSASPSSLAYIAANSNTLQNSFRVVYLDPKDINVKIEIESSVVNLSADEVEVGVFEYQLLNTKTGEVIEATSQNDGRADIVLTFTADDIDSTYTFQLYQVNGGKENILYDTTVHEIEITLVLNDEHEISAILKVDGKPTSVIRIEYVNVSYTPVPMPETGDPNTPIAWLCMFTLSCAALFILVKKLLFVGGKRE